MNGKKIKELMDEKGMSIYMLSKRSGVARHTISDLIKGKKNNCYVDTVTAIAEVLGTTPNDLICNEPHRS